MCSLNDDEENENLPYTEKPTLSETTKCRSCDERARVMLRRKDVYCKNCFLVAATHKFRATLGKSKMMKPVDKVLVAYSGSQSSAALLHLLDSGVKESEHKKILFSACILFIEEGVLFKKKLEERKNIVRTLKEILAHYNFPLYITTLGEIFSDKPIIGSDLQVNDDSDTQLYKLFQNIKSMTSKEDMLNVFRNKLLLKAALQLECNKIFIAETATDLAVKLLSTFSLGRGDKASFETGFCDSRHPTVRILRPLREFINKEIAFYNIFQNVETLSLPSITSKSLANVSIKKLTEKFITGLQEDFPSTVYTIYKTGEKLSVDSKRKEIKNVCLLCNDKIITGLNEKYSAMDAANFSKIVSRKTFNFCGSKIKEKCCGSCSSEKENNSAELELEKFLCYGCALILKDMKTLDFLPKGMLEIARRKRNYESLKDQISEFLIDPSSELEV